MTSKKTVREKKSTKKQGKDVETVMEKEQKTAVKEKKIEKVVEKAETHEKKPEKEGSEKTGKKPAGQKEKEGTRKEKTETQKEKKALIEKPESIKKLQEMIKRKHHPVFRGRFGKRKFRKVKSKKWDKWRKPRGIDIVKRKEDGMIPRTGYRTPAEIRHRHPSGYYTALVSNAKQLEALSRLKETAAVIASGVGEKKRKDIMKKAGELRIRVLNG